MFSLTWLPDVLSAAGLKVVTVPGWESRGRGEAGETMGVICHHTGGRPTGNMPSLNTLIEGRSDLAGPLAQLGLARDGTYFVIAAGRANHAGAGMWQGITTGNTNFIGIEAENTGTTNDKWPADQFDAYRIGVAAILRHIGRDASFCAGHKEYALPRGRKPDPNFDMDLFRRDVAALLRTQPAPHRRTLKRGDSDALVALIEARLGIAKATLFSDVTEQAVVDFQKRNGLVPDGIVGPETWRVIDALKG